VSVQRGGLLVPWFFSHFQLRIHASSFQNVHSGQFRRGAAGDLLDTQLTQLGLELIELFLQIVLVLAP
jgi:hypothetical protein